jgi:tetratricopeptide (TPR) repeat protein
VSPEVHRLFEEVADLSPEQRMEYLRSHTTDPDVRLEVLSLLAHDALAQPFFSKALESAASSVLSDLELRPGTRIGAFTIERMLGFGGMGTVYLAKRSDGAFEQTVAIKVIQAPNPTPLLLERFQQERQILARLNHPNIARLLDGGETPAGSPFFVMEYVSGEEVDRYCDKHALDLKARLRLFLEISAGVQYAHENLVVHRDLKPGNILIGENGVPKLLDFGIAKVVDPLSESSQSASTRVMTPDYASPEQVRGDAITTAADIYSLGAVLYRLLTGRPPHLVQNLSPLEAARKISEEDVPPASNVPGDVAAILQKALHNDPRQRYRSADEFSNDIQRYLDGKPVVAASDSLLYKTSKFLRRHWIGVLTASVVVLALTVGAGVAIWQGRRAERRFAEVRQLSNQFLFEFEGSIHNVPGTTKARELVIKTAQQYLDRLALEAGRDPQLIHELAEAYHKLGDVQGSTIEGNTGDVKAALASYRKSIALRDSVGDEHATDTAVRVAYALSLTGLANAEAGTGDPSRVLPISEKAVAVAEVWLRDGSNDPDLLSAAANAYSQLALHQQENGDFEGSMASSKRSVTLQLQARDLRPDDPKALRSLAVRYWALGSSQKVAGHAEDAIASYSTARDMLRQVAERNPGNAQSRRELIGVSWLLADTTVDLLRAQKKSQAPGVPLWQDVWRDGTKLLKEDPGNALVEADVILISMGLGTTLQQAGRPREGDEVLVPAIAMQERRYRSSPENRTAGYYLALLLDASAECQRDLHDLNASLGLHRSAKNIFDRLVSESPSNFDYRRDKAVNLKATGEILAGLGDTAGALAAYRQALPIAESLPKGPSRVDPAGIIADLHQDIDLISKKSAPKK